MKKVKREKLVLSKDLLTLLTTVHFSDSFSTTNHVDDIRAITNLIFNKAPKWLDFLFLMRNKMVKVIGLKTGIPKDYNTYFRVGGYVNYFKIFSISESQVVLGANDSHLNFRAVIKKEASKGYNIKVVTLVEFNNTKGKYYMNVIKPFHFLVMKQMVKMGYKNDQ